MCAVYFAHVGRCLFLIIIFAFSINKRALASWAIVSSHTHTHAAFVRTVHRWTARFRPPSRFLRPDCALKPPHCVVYLHFKSNVCSQQCLFGAGFLFACPRVFYALSALAHLTCSRSRKLLRGNSRCARAHTHAAAHRAISRFVFICARRATARPIFIVR